MGEDACSCPNRVTEAILSPLMALTNNSSDISASPARTVGYDAHSFLIDGESQILLAASIHYFRVPHQLWADRIAKAKRGGMNTIETYVAWNYHEPSPGTFDFQADRDLDEFITECERQGLYVIVRPGPYICAEWDYGGFPAWLQTLPGVAFRTMNAPYLAAVDSWFDALCPIIVKHLWTNGGNVILVQAENEYANLKWTRGEDMVVDDDYQRYIRDALIKRGVDVPLISCAGHISGTVECINSHHPADSMPEFRKRFPDAPLFSTEFWTAWYDAWGAPHHLRPAADLEYASWRCWAEGGCGYNYYVYHGGTNFGYTPMYLQTTSYDYDAQISETGRLTEKWRACRRVALWAQTFREILTTGTHRREIKALGNLRVSETATRERGSIVFVDNPDRESPATGGVFPYLPEVTLAPRSLFAYVHDAPIGASSRYLSAYVGLVKSDAQVLTAHLMPDPQPGARVYVYGEPGETREVVLFNGYGNGEGVFVTFMDAPQVYACGFSQIIALPSALAGRVFLAEDETDPVIIGSEDVRAHSGSFAQVELPPDQECHLWSLNADGTLSAISVTTPPLPAVPKLGAWESRAPVDMTSSDYDDSHWRELDDIAEQGNLIALNIATLGPAHGSDPYGWYRAEVRGDDAAGMDANLHFTACSDRLTLFVNGKRVGSSQPPPEDRRTDWEASFDFRLEPGRNVLSLLVDNLGLIKGDWQIGKGQEHEKKGVYGAVTLTPSGQCFQADIRRWKFHPLDLPAFPTEATPGAGEAINYHRTTFTLESPLDSSTPLLIRLEGMGKGVLWVNGRSLGRYWVTAGEGKTYGVASWLTEAGIAADPGRWPQSDYYLPEPWLNVGENVIVLMETEGASFTPDHISLIWDKNAAVVWDIAL